MGAELLMICAELKSVLAHHGIPSAPFVVIPGESLSVRHTTSLPSYPLFVKPATEGSSKGIESFNKANGPAELELAVRTLKKRFPGEDLLVESFLSGREFTVSILGTGSNSRVIGIREHIWRGSPSCGENGDGLQAEHDFAGWEDKSSKKCLLEYSDALDMKDPQVKAACKVALDTWSVFGCRDAGRVDIRLDSHEADAIPNVLEVTISP